MPGDISRPYKGPKDGSVPSWMDEPAAPTLARSPWECRKCSGVVLCVGKPKFCPYCRGTDMEAISA